MSAERQRWEPGDVEFTRRAQRPAPDRRRDREREPDEEDQEDAE